MRLAQNQPTTGATTAARAYQPQKPSNGILSRKSTASAPTATSSVVPRAEARLSVALAIVRRIWKTSSQTSRPGRKIRPQSTKTAVSQLSRSLRMWLAARQCSTTTCGSMPKDWISGLRPPPSIRTCTARENASPRFGAKIVPQARPGVTADWCHSLLALRISSTSLSRYAAEARAYVAAVWPAAPARGTWAPGLKSNPSSATPAPIAAVLRFAAFPTSVPRTPVDQVIVLIRFSA